MASLARCALCNVAFSSRNKLFKHVYAEHGDGDTDISAEERVALTLAYLGDGFHGSANCAGGTLPTVEGMLFECLGCVPPAGFTRCARTDKGVHALANVITMRLPVTGDQAGWCAEVNATLPPTLRVMQRVSVANDFDARRQCDRRRYEYVLPYAALRRQTTEPLLATRQRLKPILKAFVGAHDFARFTRQQAAYLEEQDTWRMMFRIHAAETLRAPADHCDDGDGWRPSLGDSDETDPTDGGDAFLVISISGRSFLMHQIRSMVGAIVSVMRGHLTLEQLSRALRPADDHLRPADDHLRPADDHLRPADDHLRPADDPSLTTSPLPPLAPAFPLYLASTSFAPYVRKKPSADADPADLSSCGAAVDAFRAQIHRHIIQTEVSEAPFATWVAELDRCAVAATPPPSLPPPSPPPSSLPAAEAAADHALRALLGAAGLEHLTDVLGGTTLAELSECLAVDGRAALLTRLKQAGVAKLGHRQALANAVGRAQRAASADDDGSSGRSETAARVPRPPPSMPSPRAGGPSEGARPYPAWLVAGEVPRVRWDDPALTGYLRRAEPVVIIGGCPLTRRLVGAWSFEHLAAHMADQSVMAHWAPRHVTRFNRFYSRRMGVGRAGVSNQLSFRQFAALAAANEARASKAWRFYVQAPVLWSMDEDQPDPSMGGTLPVPPKVSASRQLAHARFDETLVGELRGLDWSWLDEALTAAGSSGVHSATLWAGHGGGCTPMHWDAVSNFFTQLVGRKQVLLFPPSAWPSLYPYPFLHAMESYAMVDVESPDLDRFPALARARGLETTLEPGDVLWLPSFYWHHVRQLDDGQQNLSLNLWCGTATHAVKLGSGSILQSTVLGGRARDMEEEQQRTGVALTIEAVVASSDASAARAASPPVDRMATAAAEAADEALIGCTPTLGLAHLFAAQWLENKAAAALGVADAAPFLNAFADGADAKQPPTTTTTTMRPPPQPIASRAALALAIELRATLVSQFGVDGACALLRAVTRHGRLHPGLAPPDDPEMINSEAKQVTPLDAMPEDVATMIADCTSDN